MHSRTCCTCDILEPRQVRVTWSAHPPPPEGTASGRKRVRRPGKLPDSFSRLMNCHLYAQIPFIFPKRPLAITEKLAAALQAAQSPGADILTGRGRLSRPFRWQISIWSLPSPTSRRLCTVPLSREQAGLMGGGCLPSGVLARLWASVCPRCSICSPQLLCSPTTARLLCCVLGICWGAAARRAPRAAVLRHDPDELQAATRSLLDLRSKPNQGKQVNWMFHQSRGTRGPSGRPWGCFRVCECVSVCVCVWLQHTENGILVL